MTPPDKPLQHWLLKTEPSAFSLDDLRKAPRQTSCWDGVRNYQARNFLRTMQRDELAFLYYSSCATPGITGIVRVVRAAYPDHTAFEAAHKHFDPDSKPDNPRWFMVDVKLERAFKRLVSLDELRKHEHGRLAGLRILQRGNRLSVTPVSDVHWRFIVSLE